MPGKASTHAAQKGQRHHPHRHEVGASGPRQAKEAKPPPRFHAVNRRSNSASSTATPTSHVGPSLSLSRSIVAETAVTPKRSSHERASMPGKRQCSEALRKDPPRSNHATQTLQEAHLGTPSKVAKCGAAKGTHKAARSNNCPSFEKASANLPANGPAMTPRTTRTLQGAHLGAPLQVVLSVAPAAGNKNTQPDQHRDFVKTSALERANAESTAKPTETSRGPPRNALRVSDLQRTSHRIQSGASRPRKADKTSMRARSKSPRRSASQALEALYRCSNAARFSTATRQGVPHSNSTDV